MNDEKTVMAFWYCIGRHILQSRIIWLPLQLSFARDKRHLNALSTEFP